MHYKGFVTRLALAKINKFGKKISEYGQYGSLCDNTVYLSKEEHQRHFIYPILDVHISTVKTEIYVCHVDLHREFGDAIEVLDELPLGKNVVLKLQMKIYAK